MDNDNFHFSQSAPEPATAREAELLLALQQVVRMSMAGRWYTQAVADVTDIVGPVLEGRTPAAANAGGQEEGATLLAEVFNLLTQEQKLSVPQIIAGRIGAFMVRNGYRIVFGRWYLQAEPDTRPAADAGGLRCHLSWGGKNVYGDKASIDAVKAALHDAGTVPELKERIRFLQDRASAADAGGLPALKTKDEAQQAIQVCNTLVDVVGDDEQHPLFPLMAALMGAIGKWEDVDPELQAFFAETLTAKGAGGQS
jgi:hypothetical protein